jgi:hypothetical protein
MTEHCDELGPPPFASVHDVAERDPAPTDPRFTLPVGLLGVPPVCVSATVTVQVLTAPAGKVLGTHETLVLVLRLRVRVPSPNCEAPMLFPPLVVPLAVTVKTDVPVGVVAALVEMLSVDVMESTEPEKLRLVGKKVAVAPAGSPAMENDVTVQLPPVLVAVTTKVAGGAPGKVSAGFCEPTATV